MTWPWTRALVTGASSGIGRETARLLARDGVDLVIVARDEARLEALAAELSSVSVEVLPADLIRPSDVERVADRLRSAGDPIDLLVNNAGFGKGGPFVESDPMIDLDVVSVNVSALMTLTRAAVGEMSGRRSGAVLNISSLASLLIAPESAVYSATKAFVTSFSESLHQELAPNGVTVTASLPGLTRTEFQDRAGVDTTRIPNALWQSAEDVARASLEAAAAGKPLVVTGRVNQAAGLVAGAIPRPLLRLAGRAFIDR